MLSASAAFNDGPGPNPCLRPDYVPVPYSGRVQYSFGNGLLQIVRVLCPNHLALVASP